MQSSVRSLCSDNMGIYIGIHDNNAPPHRLSVIVFVFRLVGASIKILERYHLLIRAFTLFIRVKTRTESYLNITKCFYTKISNGGILKKRLDSFHFTCLMY